MRPPAMLELPPDPRAPGQARAYVRRVLDEWGLDGLLDVTVLLVSEVVTNALIHTGAPSSLLVERDGPGVRVTVADPSAVLPSHRRRSTTATTGRGCQLLDDLADSWGAQADGAGKRVWFVVTGEHDPWAGFRADDQLTEAER